MEGEKMKQLYDVWFSSLEISNQTKLELLEKYDTKEIWNLDFKDLLEEKISEEESWKIKQNQKLETEKRMLDYMQKKKIKLISVREESYPQKLHNIYDKPAFLYLRGDEKILDDDSVRNGWL